MGKIEPCETAFMSGAVAVCHLCERASPILQALQVDGQLREACTVCFNLHQSLAFYKEIRPVVDDQGVLEDLTRALYEFSRSALLRASLAEIEAAGGSPASPPAGS